MVNLEQVFEGVLFCLAVWGPILKQILKINKKWTGEIRCCGKLLEDCFMQEKMGKRESKDCFCIHPT